MKATELISRLAKLIEEHGDSEILLICPDSLEPDCNNEYFSKSVTYSVTYEAAHFEPAFEIYGE